MYENKQKKIEVFESELRDRVCRKNDENCVFSDLTGLYVDIIGVISERDKAKAGIIHDYAKLLEQELQLYSGKEAYIAGCEGRGKPELEVMGDYVRTVKTMSIEQRLESRIQTCFNEIVGLLGDSSGLISEFTDTYRTVHGIIASNIHEFVRLGQT